MRIWMLTGKRKVFTSTWKTDNVSSGSSTDHQVKLPLESSGTYNFLVDWGDNKKSTITTYNQAEVTHTYTTIGTYTVKIRGVCKGFRFNNDGDRLKLLTISNWGDLELGNNDSTFRGCSNFTTTTSSRLKNFTMTKLYSFLRDCTSYNSTLDWIDSRNVYEFIAMFYGCTNFNSSISALNFDSALTTHYVFYGCTKFNQPVLNLILSNVADMQYMFYGCGAFNQAVSNFNTANVTYIASIFEGCTALNQAVNTWNTAKITNMQRAFAYCTNFDQDISSWNFEAVTTMANMLLGATSWSTTNYDKFLISAAAQNVKTNVSFTCETKYTAGGAAEAARSYLQTTKIWNIVDGGAA